MANSKNTNQPKGSVYKRDVENQSAHDSNRLDIATQEKAPKDPNIVNWDGPDDPENPLNWSSSKKFGPISMVSLITMLS